MKCPEGSLTPRALTLIDGELAEMPTLQGHINEIKTSAEVAKAKMALDMEKFERLRTKTYAKLEKVNDTSAQIAGKYVVENARTRIEVVDAYVEETFYPPVGIGQRKRPKPHRNQDRGDTGGARQNC